MGLTEPTRPCRSIDLSEESYNDRGSDYAPLYPSGHDGLCKSDSLEPDYNRHYKGKIVLTKRTFGAIVIANIVLFTTSFIWMVVSTSNGVIDEQDISTYSPVFDHVDVKRTTKHFNFTFWPEDPPSIFQLPPSPEVDEAWARFATPGSLPITSAEARKSGRDPATLWPFDPRDAGEDKYFGMIDFVHQAHCLDMFRKSIWPDYYGDFREKSKGAMFPWEDHMLHCQEVLMQHILCHADLEMIYYYKFKGFRGPDAQFTVDRKCRNIDEIMQWKEEHEIVPQGPFIEVPHKPIIELDPEFVLTPKGSHSCHTGLKETNGNRHCQSI